VAPRNPAKQLAGYDAVVLRGDSGDPAAGRRES